jgi:hypothetical protein
MCPSRSSRSRRNFLRALGGSVCAVTGGCLGLDQLQRSAAGSRDRSVTESNPEHTAESFAAYVDRMRERYGEYGVWGINPKMTGMEKLSFIGAWSGGWTLRKPKTSEDNGQLRIPMDYAAVLYRVRGRTDKRGRPVHRVWLWAAARPRQSDEGYGGTTLVELSFGIALDGTGVLSQYAPGTNIGPEDAPVRIELSGPKAPSGVFPIPAGRIQPSPETTTESNGLFAVDWAGAYGSTVSVAGVCELQRAPKNEYTFTVTSEVSGTQGTL